MQATDEPTIEDLACGVTELPSSLAAEAAELALRERPDNRPGREIVLETAQATGADMPMTAVFVTRKRWRPGRVITVSFMPDHEFAESEVLKAKIREVWSE